MATRGWTTKDLIKAGRRISANQLLINAGVQAKPRKVNYKRMADELFMRRYRGKPCEVCGTSGLFNTWKTCGHHFIPKSVSRALRYDPRNMVVCCPGHHRFGLRGIGAHSTSAVVCAAFVDWFKKQRAADWAYVQAHQHDKCRETWKQAAQRMGVVS